MLMKFFLILGFFDVFMLVWNLFYSSLNVYIVNVIGNIINELIFCNNIEYCKYYRFYIYYYVYV